MKKNIISEGLKDFSEEWTDEKLYTKYSLTQEEINFIENSIKVMN